MLGALLPCRCQIYGTDLPGRTRGGLTAREDSIGLTLPGLTLPGRAMFARGSRRRRSGRAVSDTRGSGGSQG